MKSSYHLLQSMADFHQKSNCFRCLITAMTLLAALNSNAARDSANLTFDISAARTVTIDTTPRIVGTLNMGDPTLSFFGYTLAASGGATLTFNNNGSGALLAKLTDNTALDLISAPITLAD